MSRECDDDREGEAIAWHICDEFNLPLSTKRIVFHEITKKAINNAVNGTSLAEDDKQAFSQIAQNTTRGSVQNYAGGKQAFNIDIDSINDQKKSGARNFCSYSPNNETTNNSCELFFDLEQYTNGNKIGSKKKKAKFNQGSHRIYDQFKSRFETVEGIPLPKQRELGTRQMADSLYSYVAHDCGLPNPMVDVVVDAIMKRIPEARTPNFFLKADKGMQVLRDVVGFVREQEGLPPLVAERKDSEEQQILTEATNPSSDDGSEQVTERFRRWMERTSVIKHLDVESAFERAMQQDGVGELGEEKVRQMVADYKRRI